MGSWGSLVAQQPQRRTSTAHHTQRNPVQPPPNLLNAGLFRPPRMSPWSSPPVPNSSWADKNFLLGAGMVIFQPATSKVVVLYEGKKKYWFLPKGRKDVGESLEQTALREAYEESGYQVEFLPLHTSTQAPGPPNNPHAPWELNCEPIYINATSYPARKRRNVVLPPGEYLSFWYVGQIPADAVREEGTGMPDEVNYEAHLMDVKEALKLLNADEAQIVDYASKLFAWTLQEEHRRQSAASGSGSGSTSSLSLAS